MFDNLYKVNWFKPILDWLPTFLRQGILHKLSNAMISPIVKMFPQFMAQRKQGLLRMKHTYAVFSLRWRLNDVFDKYERRIRIVSALKFNGVYLYTEGEDDQYKSKTKWLGTVYLRNESELFSDYDFIVEIPNTGIDQLAMIAEIDYFVLPSKRYKILIV